MCVYVCVYCVCSVCVCVLCVCVVCVLCVCIVCVFVCVLQFNSFAGNSAILLRSCYNEATFCLTIKVFGVHNILLEEILFSRQIRRSCLQSTFSRNAYSS